MQQVKLIPYSKQFLDAADLKSVLKSLNQEIITQGPCIEKLEKP